MPQLARFLCLVSFSLQLYIRHVLGQSENYFTMYPDCAQQYLNSAFPAECDTEDTITTMDECLCSNTGNFLSNSALDIGANCGCPVLATTAYLLVSICDEYAGGISLDEGQIIAAGWGGDTSCPTATTSTSSPSTTTAPSSSSSTTPSSPSPAPASKTAVPVTKSSGLDADGIVSLVVGIPAAVVSIIQLIGWWMTGDFKWMFAGCCGRRPQPKVSYHSLGSSRTSY